MELFDNLNERYFRGRLPRYRVTHYSFMPRTVRGQTLRDRRLIRLAQGLSPRVLRMTLLHEMLHIQAEDHGCRFQDGLMSLARRGEGWAAKEASQYRAGPLWNKDMQSLRDRLSDVAYLVPRPTFPAVLKWLACDLGKSPGELLRAAPWVRQTWRKAKAEAEDLRRSGRGRT